MNTGRVARVLRAIRLHQDLSQQAVADKARISQSAYSRAELGDLAGMTIGTFERVAGALGADVRMEVRFRGGLGDRLADAMHAALVDLTVGVLTSLDWLVELEYGFNVFGERGSVDILAWHASTRTLLTVEVKSRFTDLQAMLLSPRSRGGSCGTRLGCARGRPHRGHPGNHREPFDPRQAHGDVRCGPTRSIRPNPPLAARPDWSDRGRLVDLTRCGEGAGNAPVTRRRAGRAMIRP
jgi:transcriptional regulator with XRE-family HTH domain